MTEREAFNYRDSDVEIYRHPDGALTIEVTAEYGDSEIGWGSTTKTIYFDPELVVEFTAFLARGRSAA